MKLYACEQQNNKGVILFIHGFNSSHKIWGNVGEYDSFVHNFYNRGYN